MLLSYSQREIFAGLVFAGHLAAKNARMCWAVLNKGEAFLLPA